MATDEIERFRERYSVSHEEALLAAEMDTLDSDYQANGYTTRAQADEIGDVLGLAPGQVLLDLGAGCGWPGLYLAARHGCAVVSLDPVIEGVVVARHRSVADGLSARAWAIQSRADAIPLRPRSVDAVVHADVRC